MQRALANGWAVTGFVRNPARVPDDLRARVTLHTGDLNDAASVKAAVCAVRPSAIVEASSALPFGHAKGQPANNADRSILLKATLEALEADGRTRDCVLIIVGGQLFPEPGGTINSWGVAALACCLRMTLGQAWRDAEATIKWLFDESNPDFRFVYCRMGYMVEEPTRGALRPEATEHNIQRGKASFCDVADALVALAEDEKRTWERKALFFNYASAAA